MLYLLHDKSWFHNVDYSFIEELGNRLEPQPSDLDKPAFTDQEIQTLQTIKLPINLTGEEEIWKIITESLEVKRVGRIGEIIGGSQREERYDKLLSRMKEMNISEKQLWWYLETRKFGTVPHSGFGLGFERLVQFVTGMSNIRDVIPFPRYPSHLEF